MPPWRGGRVLHPLRRLHISVDHDQVYDGRCASPTRRTLTPAPMLTPAVPPGTPPTGCGSRGVCRHAASGVPA